jgi:EAL domain-containing protein (putative c-di-GMP-specific phosphodiesterase class I)
MELTVLAEGVETAEQRDALTSLGCSCFQGFLFGHPVSRGDFERRWTRYDTPPLCA